MDFNDSYLQPEQQIRTNRRLIAITVMILFIYDKREFIYGWNQPSGTD
ncbi:hypothetical protein AwEntero_27110 [Enterobacterales bacterium]|nr:hypothetical protein AwEntero_27110 [Enterobacterales bacterium]